MKVARSLDSQCRNPRSEQQSFMPKSVCALSDGHLRLWPARPRLQSSIGGTVIGRIAIRLRPSPCAGSYAAQKWLQICCFCCRAFTIIGSRAVGGDGARRLALEQRCLTECGRTHCRRRAFLPATCQTLRVEEIVDCWVRSMTLCRETGISTRENKNCCKTARRDAFFLRYCLPASLITRGSANKT